MGERVEVVTAFLRHAGAVLLLRRSQGVGSYRGHWAAVSGYLEEPTALAQALREIEEETGIVRSDLQLVRAGVPMAVDDPALDRQWVVHPFLFELAAPPKVRLDWEHSAFRWVEPAALAGLPTVPRLAAVLEACWPEAFAAGREDRRH